MKINTNQTAKIEEIIKEVQAKSTARNIDIETVQFLIDHAEEKLKEMLLPKTEWIGTKLTWNESITANSYGYQAESTEITIEKFASNWFITKLERAQTYQSQTALDMSFSFGEKAQNYLCSNKYLKKLERELSQS